MQGVEAYQKISEGEEKPHRSIVYPDTGHGFLNSDSRNFDPQASKSAWEETIKHFGMYLS